MTEELANKTIKEATMNITLHPNTNNVTRTTFYYIRDNTGVTRAEATVALEHAGFNGGSVTSLIGQMLKNRLVRDEDGRLYANQKEYTPLKTFKPFYTHTKKHTHKHEEAPVVQQPSPMAQPIPAEWSADAVIDKLSVKQAMAVYGELRKIFGA